MTDPRPLIRGAFVGLGVVVLFCAFATALVWGTTAAAKLPPPKLSTWQNARVLSELGEANQMGACDDIIGGPGFTARYYLDEPHKRLVVICVPS